jgi:glycosyltransferase involved in cell wall biosynthesis
MPSSSAPAPLSPADPVSPAALPADRPPAPVLPTIAVVIPAYRAAAHIRSVLAGIPDFVSYIVVVDDCGPDETAEIVRAWDDDRVHLVSHQVNQGVGGATLTGYDAAVTLGAEVIVKMDSDDQMDPTHMLPLIAPVAAGRADYAKGNRFIHTRELRSMPLLRRVGNTGLSFLAKIASGYWGLFDPTNGYTAIHASVVRRMNRDNIDKRYFFETSMLIELSLIRAVIEDVYIPARYSDEISSLSSWNSLVTFPRRLLRGFLYRLYVQYIVRDFNAFSLFLIVGLLLSAFGTAWGGYHWVQSAIHDTPASTGTVMLAVVPIILGLQLLLQAVTLDIQNVPAQPLQIQELTREAFLRAGTAQGTGGSTGPSRARDEPARDG